MTHKAAKTGPGAMVLVAIEQYFPEGSRIINDDLAYRIMPFGYRAYIWLIRHFKNWLIRTSEKKTPGLWGSIISRKRYIDDKVAEYADDQIGAIVNLGAGFDTRTYRLPALKKVPVWEVDLRENIEAKRLRLRKIFHEVPAHVTLVPINFDREEMGVILTSHGYSSDRKTFYIWEGVTQYLTEVGILRTFDFLSTARAGSRLVFTYVPKDFIAGNVFYGQEYLYKKMLQKDKCWFFDMDPNIVAEFLSNFGWHVLEHLSYGELAERYVKPTGRKLLSMAIERIVYAETF
jgi:methyltransferase (TIGR00027 family)